MLKPKYICIAVLLSFFFLQNGEAQRFSLVTEAGYVRSQLDGDKIQGFYHQGFNVALGTNYAFNTESFLAIRSLFSYQGSRRRDKFQPKLREGFQLELDVNSIGVEISYKFAPENKNFFLGAGLVRHQLVNLNYEVIDNTIDEEDLYVIESDRLRSGYNSVKGYYGFDLFPRAGLYLAAEVAFTDIVRVETDELRTLAPYSLSAVFTYEIIASKVEVQKKRPGSKTRGNSNPRKKKKRR